MCLKSVLALLQFTTILPLGRTVDLEHFARRLYLYPLAGYMVGGIAALAVVPITPSPLSAAIALSLVLLLSGFHHLDGLLDLGDAAMVQDREKRLRILSDPHVGTGGAGLGIAVTLCAFGALASAGHIAAAILTSEVIAKVCMTGVSVFGRPFREGIHAYLYARTKRWFVLPAYLLALPLFLLPLPAASIALAILASLPVVCLVLLFSHRLFGGVNGDVVGATNEIARATTLVVIAFGVLMHPF